MIAVPNKDKKRSYSVIDETTGEVVETISRRQYDKRFGVLAKEGFNSYEARSKAEKYIVERHEKAGSIHHIYNLGLPLDINAAIAHTIDRSPHFGTKMMLEILLAEDIDYTRVRKGRKEHRVVNRFGTTTFGKNHGDIQFMLDELKMAMDKYNLDYEIINYTLHFIDRLR